MKESSFFDARYYQKYYQNPRTRVTDTGESKRRGDFVCAYINFLQLNVRSVLDLGCGIGQWQSVVKSHFPTALYQGVEYSRFLCDKYGWQQGSVIDYRSRRKFDLVVCQDVLQYLPPSQAVNALENIARLCRGVLYLQVLTEKDWRENCDQTRTDGEVYKRTGNWYRNKLKKSFRNIGGGLFSKRDINITFWELECLD